MVNPGAMLDSMFRRARNVSWDLGTGRVGVRQKNALITLKENAQGRKTLVRNPLDAFSMKIPAFALLTPPAGLTPGDLIVSDPDARDNGSNLSFFLKSHGVQDDGDLTNAEINVLGLNGQRSNYAVADILFMESGVLAVKSIVGNGVFGNEKSLLPMLFLMKGAGKGKKTDIGKLFGLMALFGSDGFSSMFGGPQAGTGSMEELKKETGGFSMEGLMPMMLMSSIFKGGEGGMGNLMQMLMFSRMTGADMKGMAPMLALSGMLSGEEGPFSGLFDMDDEDEEEDDEEEEEEEDDEEEEEEAPRKNPPSGRSRY